MRTDTERLDPCPFCGGDAERRIHDWRVPDSNAAMDTTEPEEEG